MGLPRLLWVCAVSDCESKVARVFADEFFDITVTPSARGAHLLSQRIAPQVVCWDFEEPQGAQLRAMRDFKAANPSVPMLMLTTRHSEQLAIWAFRVRVWNYLIKPVPVSELRANFSTLAQLVTESHGPPRSLRFVRTLLPEDVDNCEERPRGPSVRAAVAHVEQHYAEKLRQTEVAGICGLSSYQFSRAFKLTYGRTYRDYLIRFRISRACRLLRQGAHTATSAGMAVGFEDPSHFARAFRKLLGMSPSAYQREKPPLRPKVERRRRARQALGVKTTAAQLPSITTM